MYVCMCMSISSLPPEEWVLEDKKPVTIPSSKGPGNLGLAEGTGGRRLLDGGASNAL